MYLDELIASIYLTQSNPAEVACEKIGFLKSLNQVDGYSFESLVTAMIKCLKNVTAANRNNNNNLDEKIDGETNEELELVYRLFILVMINTNEFKAGSLMRQLLTLETNHSDENKTMTMSSSSLEESMLVKIRVEIGPFHENCFADALKSVVNYLVEIEPDDVKLNALVNNMILVYEWDIQNKCSMK